MSKNKQNRGSGNPGPSYLQMLQKSFARHKAWFGVEPARKQKIQTLQFRERINKNTKYQVCLFLASKKIDLDWSGPPSQAPTPPPGPTPKRKVKSGKAQNPTPRSPKPPRPPKPPNSPQHTRPKRTTQHGWAVSKTRRAFPRQRAVDPEAFPRRPWRQVRPGSFGKKYAVVDEARGAVERGNGREH